MTPTVALIMQLTGPPSRSKAPIFLASVSVFGKTTQRCTREAPTKACTTAPTPIVVGIAADVEASPHSLHHAVPMLAINDPIQMPGHT